MRQSEAVRTAPVEVVKKAPLVHCSIEQYAAFSARIVMSTFARLFLPGSTELPECRCGTIRIASIERLPEEATRAFGYLAAPLAIMKYGYVWAASSRLFFVEETIKFSVK